MERENCVRRGLAGENAYLFRDPIHSFLRQVAKFIKAQCVDMLHHVIAKIGLHGYFLRRCETFRQHEWQFILPEQMTVASYQIYIEGGKISRLATLRSQSECHECCCDYLRVLAVNRRVGHVTHRSLAAKMPQPQADRADGLSEGDFLLHCKSRPRS